MKNWTAESLCLAGASGILVLAAGLALVAVVRVEQPSLDLLAIGAVLASLLAVALSNRRLRDEIKVRKAAEQALAGSERRLLDIVSMLPVALVVKDPESRITLMNRAAEDGWGVRFADVAGNCGSEQMQPGQIDEVLASDRAAFAMGELQVQETQVWNAAQERCYRVESYKKPVFDSGGKPLYLICAYVDITARKQAEEGLQLSLRQLRRLAAGLELLKEEDHRRIAKGIHDDLGQNLMALKLDVEMLRARAGKRASRLSQRVGQALDTIDATIRSVRAIMNDLHPSTLELGLPAALEWLVEQFEVRTGIACALRVAGDGPLPDARRTAVIFRIVQEALLYILRHSSAGQVDIALAVGAAHLSITIDDDGGGTDGGSEAQVGLRGIRERVLVFGGELATAGGGANPSRLSILIPTRAHALADV